MTPENLLALIIVGETLDVEFKGEEARAVTDSDLVEAVVCLANRPGDRPGWLLIGVEDDGRITGTRPRHHDRTDPLRVQALIANRTRPSFTARVEVVSLEGKDILVVEVPAGRSPVGTTEAKYLRRAPGSSSERPAASIPFSSSNCGMGAQYPATSVATRAGSRSRFPAARPTSLSPGSLSRKARRGTRCCLTIFCF